MNFNISVTCHTCHTCHTQTNCRLGMSNRDIQPLRFRCFECGSPIDITMTPDFIKTEMDIQVSGASQIPTDEFKPEVNFIDLHLDFPASFEPYKMGYTPFMRAVSLIGHKNMQEHSFRVNYLNDVHNREKEIKEIFTLYNSRNALLFKDKKNHFKDKVLAFLDEDLECDTDLDNNRALYLAIEKAFLPFSEPQKNVDTVHLFTRPRTRPRGQVLLFA